MSQLTEIRWHARAGQGAKTAAQTLALALLAEGKSVQAFPEYGPERRGAPLRAFTRISDTPIRRHDGVTEPGLVVVLEPSLVHETDVTEGLLSGGAVLINADERPAELAAGDVHCIPADRIAADHNLAFANIAMLGAVAAWLGAPSLEHLQDAAVRTLGAKASNADVRAAVAEGYAWPR